MSPAVRSVRLLGAAARAQNGTIASTSTGHKREETNKKLKVVLNTLQTNAGHVSDLGFHVYSSMKVGVNPNVPLPDLKVTHTRGLEEKGVKLIYETQSFNNVTSYSGSSPTRYNLPNCQFNFITYCC